MNVWGKPRRWFLKKRVDGVKKKSDKRPKRVQERDVRRAKSGDVVVFQTFIRTAHFLESSRRGAKIKGPRSGSIHL
jgi:hypothetical protein